MGPLAGVRIVELAGIGPGPLCAMFLADLGATVIRVDRKQASGVGVARPLRFDLVLRNRKSIRVDLKDPAAVALVLELVERADALIEGYRPGVTERLGLGPEPCLDRNPKLVYARLTGWGQAGPLAQAAGHDINYIAVTGALHAIGRDGQPPTIPLNLLGDYAGGSLYAAFGIVSAILEARNSGRGQVVDAAMVDGVASLMTMHVAMRQAGMSGPQRGRNMFDSGAPFYDTYECADGRWLAVGPVEDKFFVELLRRLDLDPAAFGDKMDPANWPRLRESLAQRLRTRTRDEWSALLEGSDACAAPVLDLDEAYHHPHLKARGTYLEIDGVQQPAPGPRYSRTVPDTPQPPAALTAENAVAALRGWLSDERVAALASAGVFN